MSKKNTQFFDWGEIEWIYESESGNSLSVINIGVCTIFPDKRQNKHIHYGDEQFIYTISGKGKQLIENEISLIEPGLIFHIEAGSMHETINIGNEPIRQLLISIPVYQENIFPLQNNINKFFDFGDKHEKIIKIDKEIKHLYDEIINILKIPISIFDKEHNLLIRGDNFPNFCIKMCNIDADINNCCLYKIHDKYIPPQYKESSAFVCPYGLTVFVLPIIYNNEVIGIIKGGHVLTSENKFNLNHKESIHENNMKLLYESIQIVPKGTIRAILYQMRKLSKNIVNYYMVKNAEMEFSRKEKIIQDITKNEFILEESLRTTKEKVLSIQINNHFLFNTLNALASLSVQEGSYRTYESIINLSKMLRYPVKVNSSFVELRDEVDYLNNYFKLQQLRYGNKLKIKLNISDEIKDTIIPFNCLQPIVENSFIHGFINKKDDLHIQVNAIKDKNSILIKIVDNGIGINEKNIEKINNDIKGHDNKTRLSGLKLIYSKFQLLYNSNFKFHISSEINNGTIVDIRLPSNIV